MYTISSIVLLLNIMGHDMVFISSEKFIRNSLYKYISFYLLLTYFCKCMCKVKRNKGWDWVSVRWKMNRMKHTPFYENDTKQNQYSSPMETNRRKAGWTLGWVKTALNITYCIKHLKLGFSFQLVCCIGFQELSTNSWILLLLNLKLLQK